jgi:hypothetical protein
MTEVTTAAVEPDIEFAAMTNVYNALKPLDPQGRGRVLNSVTSLLEIVGKAPTSKTPSGAEAAEEAAIVQEEAAAPKYETFADLYDAAGPNKSAEKALVAGYWLQVCQQAAVFDGFSANKELKNLGHEIKNITNAIEALKTQKPSLALQVGKSGKSQQARKKYKITVAGIKAVEAMTNG